MDSDTKLKSKLEKWESKTDKYKASIIRLDMKSQAIQDKQDRPMKTHSVTIYSDNEAGGKVHFRIDTTQTTKCQHENNKSRGLLHKLDAHIQTENIGFVVPIINTEKQAKGANGAINGNFKKITVSLQSKALPSVLRDAAPYTKKTLLAAENAVLKTADAFKHTAQPVMRSAVGALRTQVSNQVYKAAHENTGLKATVGTASAAISTGRMLQKWSSNKKNTLHRKRV